MLYVNEQFVLGFVFEVCRTEPMAESTRRHEWDGEYHNQRHDCPVSARTSQTDFRCLLNAVDPLCASES